VQLAKQMQMPEDPSQLSDVQRLRIYHYYLPVYFWCRAQIQAHKATGSSKALVVSRSTEIDRPLTSPSPVCPLTPCHA
jgi:D-glycerate 3-kinase